VVLAGAGVAASAPNPDPPALTVPAGGATAHKTVRAAGPSRLAVAARGHACADVAPRLVLTVDGARRLTAHVGGRVTLRAPGVLAAGRHRLGLRLANPRKAGRCTRRIRIERFVLTPAPAGAPAYVPPPTATWQWQLTTPVDPTVEADFYDIDLFDNSASVVADLHARGRHVACYLSAGTYESGRPDSASFPGEVRGKELPDWPGERWLDIRRLDELGPILEARLDLCRSKGFDAVEPDNVDAYANDSGFPLTAADQLRFNRWIARAAHARGLSVGLKNDLDQAAALEPAFDWALNEQCFQYDECDKLAPFIRAGKAVFVAEYELGTDLFCGRARRLGVMAMRKHLELDAWREPCWS
jgi:hypothetical protein